MFHFARDRFSARPLSYALLNGKVLVSSELKAFLADPDFPRVVNTRAIPPLFDVGFVSGPDTLFEQVFKALPGEVTTIRSGRPAGITPFTMAMPPVERRRTVPGLAALVDDALERTVTGLGAPSTRMGVLLSGGIDSALLASKLPSRLGGEVHAVSFGASDWEAEESGAAARIAAALGVPFTRAQVDSSFDALASLESAIWHLEEPTRFETSMALEVAFAAVAPSVDVVASGEGADLLFGSGFHFAARWIPLIWRLPRAPRRAAARWLRRGRSRWRVLAGRYLDTNRQADFLLRSGAWAPISEAGPAQTAMHERMVSIEDRFSDLASDGRITVLEMVSMSGSWIERIEQTGAAHGIDVVNPYLTNEMLECAVGTAYRLKVGRAGTTLKPALALLAEKNIGPDVARRPKKQFAAPYQMWLEHSPGLRQAALDLRRPDSRYRSFVDVAWIDPILEDFADNGTASRRTSRVVLMLLGLESWLRQFVSDGRTGREV